MLSLREGLPQMANFNENVSITGTLMIVRALEQTGIEAQSIEDAIPHAGVHINTINTGGTTPYVLAVAVGLGIQGESLSSTGVTGRSQSGFGVLVEGLKTNDRRKRQRLPPSLLIENASGPLFS
jgi:hypothetical protein